MPSKYSEEWDYICPRCGSDDTEIVEQEDVIDDYSGDIIGIARLILCNECGHEWRKKHKYAQEQEDEDF
ncbi:MAG: hypothetical protein ACTSW4_02325 [Candidatus Ranarchaeia archaeon]